MSEQVQPGKKLSRNVRILNEIAEKLQHFSGCFQSEEVEKEIAEYVHKVMGEIANDADAIQFILSRLKQTSESYTITSDEMALKGMTVGVIVGALENAVLDHIDQSQTEEIRGETYAITRVAGDDQIIVDEAAVPEEYFSTKKVLNENMVLVAAKESMSVPGITIKPRFKLESVLQKKVQQ